MNDAAAARHDRRAATISVAAILLVLHWILPGALSFGANLPGNWQSTLVASSLEAGQNAGDEHGPGYDSGPWDAQPFHVPRFQPRITSLETSLPDGRDDGRRFGGSAVLSPISADAAQPGEDWHWLVRTAALRVGSQSAFDARGPPQIS